MDKQQPFAQVIAEFEDDGDGQNPPTATLTDDALTKRFTYGDDLVTQESNLDAVAPDEPATHYFHTDGQLSTRQLTDDAGTVDNTDYRYDAFGEDLANTGLPVASPSSLATATATPASNSTPRVGCITCEHGSMTRWLEGSMGGIHSVAQTMIRSPDTPTYMRI